MRLLRRSPPVRRSLEGKLACQSSFDTAVLVIYPNDPARDRTLTHRSHLPYLFIGKEHLQLANISLAKDWLLAAQNINATDPLVLNELGVVAYNQEEWVSNLLILLIPATHTPSASSDEPLQAQRKCKALRPCGRARIVTWVTHTVFWGELIFLFMCFHQACSQTHRLTIATIPTPKKLTPIHCGWTRQIIQPTLR